MTRSGAFPLRGLAGLLALAGAVFLPFGAAEGFGWFAASNWKWHEERDEITDDLTSTALVTTTRATIAGSRWGHGATAGIQCFRGRAVILIGWTENAAGSKNMLVEFRFAGRDGHRAHARYLNRRFQQTSQPEDIRAFLDGAASSNELYVRVSSDLYGTSEARFATRGGKEMVERFKRACPSVEAY